MNDGNVWKGSGVWFRMLLCFGSLSALVSPIGGDAALEKEPPDKRDGQAKDAAEEFVKAISKANIEQVMKIVDVPFYFGAAEEDRETIKDRDSLKKKLEATLRPDPVEYKVVAISSFGSLPEALFHDLLPKETDETLFTQGDQKLLKEILKKEDRVVFFMIERDVLWAVAVRAQDRKAKVLGVRTHLSRLGLAILVQDREKRDKATEPAREKAKEAALAFLKAIKAKELEGTLKLADVPWLSNGQQIIKDADGLKKRLVSILRRSQALPDEVLPISVTYGGIKDMFKEKRQQFADKVLTKDDWAVVVGRKGKATELVWVRVRDGKGKVIGFE
jgi:hypothetical protein